jgi:TonB family protein
MRTSDIQRQSPQVIEEPKRYTALYFIVAIVAAIVVWSLEQQSVWESGKEEPTASRSDFSRNNRVSKAEHEESRSAHPARGDLRTLFSADDYPAAAQAAGEEGTVQVQLAVDQRGMVTGCTIMRSSGHSSLDNETCNILQQRARFIPAQDVNGVAVPDQVTSPPVTWRLEG